MVDICYKDCEATRFIASRTIASRPSFINERKLQRRIFAFLAKNLEKYGVIIFAFIIMGAHTHMLWKLPNANQCSRGDCPLFYRLWRILETNKVEWGVFHLSQFTSQLTRCHSFKDWRYANLKLSLISNNKLIQTRSGFECAVRFNDWWSSKCSGRPEEITQPVKTSAPPPTICWLGGLAFNRK